VPSVLIARTDALSAELSTSEHDPRDREFLTGDRTAERFFRVREVLDAGDRALARVRAVRGRHLVRDVDTR
jgi:isocitrate lyase